MLRCCEVPHAEVLPIKPIDTVSAHIVFQQCKIFTDLHMMEHYWGNQDALPAVSPWFWCAAQVAKWFFGVPHISYTDKLPVY